MGVRFFFFWLGEKKLDSDLRLIDWCEHGYGKFGYV